MLVKRVILIILFALPVISVSVGCTYKSEKEPVSKTSKLSGKIVFATNRIDIANDRLKALGTEFMKQNPGTEVSIEGIKDYDQTIETRLAAGEAPDIYNFIEMMTKSTLSDYYLPIDNLGFTKDSIAFYSEGQGSDGKLYGVTEGVIYEGIVYNKKAFETAGIKATPKTIGEFYSVCERLKASGITPLGTAFKDQWPLYPWSSVEYVTVAQTGSIQHKFQYSKQDKIIDEVMLNSFELIRNLHKKGYLEEDLVSSNWDRLKWEMSEAKVAMYYVGNWFPPQLVDNGAAELGMFPYPGGKAILASAAKIWGVSKDTKAPELAKAFLNYLMMDGKLAKAEYLISSLKGVVPSDRFVKELLGSGLPVVQNEGIDEKYKELINKSDINLEAVLQAYILAADDIESEKIVKTTNEKWAAVRK
ncbi:MAG: carbohydrate ABC transporter substrate-binding protein [Clostridiaceae bacterium]|nr:carbohydrate ABC transporter substrate-binding protein [Clostridiaceae bacterium]